VSVRSRLIVLLAWASTVLIWPSVSHAQGGDAFVEGLTQLIGVSDGTYGDEGATLVAAIDAMASGLAEWDARIATVKSRLDVELKTAPPPVAARMHTALGTAYLERGRIEAALTQFAAVADLDPSFGDVHVLRGLAYQRAKRADEAAAAYRSALERNPENAASAYWVSRFAPTTPQPGSRDPVLRVLSAAVRRRIESGGPPSPDGSGVAGGGPGFLTADLLNDASVQVPVFPRAAYGAGFDLLRQGRYDEALSQLRVAVSQDSLVTDRALQSDEATRGIAALRQQSLAAAIASLDAAARRHAESSDIHRILGVAYSNGRQYKDSLTHLRTAARLSPGDERPRLSIADVLVASGDVAGARETLRETVRDIPGSIEAYWKLGRLAEAVGDGADALQAFEHLATLPVIVGRGRVYATVGRLLHSQFNLAAAAVAYEQRVGMTPNDHEAHFDLAEVYRGQDRLDEALIEYLVSALLDPASAKAFAMIGQVYAAAGHEEEAVRALRRAVDLDPDQLAARYGLSRALMRLGRTEEGRRELAVFEEGQKKAMEEERRRFLENQRKIDDTLKAGESKGLAR
jgi:tetratricopeptide (TPR) repeat protein